MIAAGRCSSCSEDAFSYQGPAPASVEMVAFNEPDAYVSQEASSAPSQSDLEVSNGLENVNETGTVYTGEVTNNTGKDLGAQQEPAGQPSDPAAQPQPAGQPQPAAQPQPAGQ